MKLLWLLSQYITPAFSFKIKKTIDEIEIDTTVSG